MIFLCLFFCVTCVSSWDNKQKLNISSLNIMDAIRESISRFYYFSYDNNMLEERMHLNYPNATLFGPALLKHHRLDFTIEAPWWNGAVATICRDRDAEVWGALWSMNIVDMEKFDRQEGIIAGWYHTKEVVVYYEGRSPVKAVTFVQNHSPKKLQLFETLPPERQPSLTYLKAMIQGAIKARLPDEYIQFLERITHNGKFALKQPLIY